MLGWFKEYLLLLFRGAQAPAPAGIIDLWEEVCVLSICLKDQSEALYVT